MAYRKGSAKRIMEVKWWLIIAAVLALVIVMGPLRMSGICSREEERRAEDGK